MDEQVIMHKGMRFDRKVIVGILEGNKEEAEEILGDKDKLEEFLQRLEEKMRDIPNVGEFFADVVVLVSLVRSYAKKEYDALPVGTMKPSSARSSISSRRSTSSPTTSWPSGLSTMPQSLCSA